MSKRIRIKGITIKLGADTTELNKAIKGVDSELRNTQSQLRDVNRLLKMDPGNAELLAQKQRILGDAIEETKNKLGTLKEAQEQAAEALAKGEISQQQYDGLQREIIQTEQDLKRLEQQAIETNKALADPSVFDGIGKAGQKLQEVGDKVTEVGKGMTKNVTVPIVAIGAASMKAFSEVDKGFDTIVKKTGASGKALDDMKKSMEEIATRIPTDFETAGAAIGEVNTRFGLTGTELENLSEKFIKFADLNNTDVSNSIDQTQKVMEAFGLKAEDAGDLLDTLNAVGQSTGISMDTLASSMVTNAAALNEMGLSASDSAFFLGNLEKSGVDTSQVMTGLKKAVVEAAKEGKTLPDVLNGFSETMRSSASDTEKLQAAIDIFGSRAGPAIYQAAKSGTLSLDELGTSLQDNLGSVDKTFETTMDGTDKMKTTFNQLKVAGAELGASIGDVLAPIMESLAGAIRKLAQWFQNLNPKTKELIVKIALLAAAIGPVLVVVGKIIGVVGTIMSLVSTIGPIIAGLAGPIGIVVAAIAGAIAAGVLLYKNWDTIKEKAAVVWEGIKNIIGGVIDMFKSIPEKWAMLWDTVKSVFEGVWNALMANPIVQLFLQLITDEITMFADVLSTIWEHIRSIAATAWELIKTAILGPVTLIVDLVTGDFGKLKDDVKEIFTRLWELTGQLWGEIFETIADVVKEIFEGVKKTLTNLLRNMSEIWDSIKTGVSNAWKGIKNAIESWANSAKDTAINIFRNLVTGIGNALSGLYNVVRDAFSNAFDYIWDVIDDAWTWGEDLMINFANGIASGVTWVWDQIWDLVGWIEDMIGFSEPDKGPLSRFHTYGPDMMQLLAKGIKDNAYLVRDAIGDVSGLIAGGVSGATSNYNYGPMSINVYGAEGQDVRELARIVENRISDNMRRTGAVFR